MRTKNLFYGFAAMVAVSASLSSCSNDDWNEQNPDGRTPITLTSNIASSRVIDQNFQNTQIASGVQVGVYARSSATGNPLIADNQMLTADGNGNFTGDPIYYPTDGSSVSIYAYAPYNLEWNSKLESDNTFTVAADQSTDDGFTDSDLLRGVPDDNSLTQNNDAVSVRFKHMLTKLNINFDTGDTDVSLQGAEISIMNTLPTTTLNVYSGTIGSATGKAQEIKAAEFADEAGSFTASAVIVPQAISANTELVRVKLADNSTVIDASLNENVTFESGKKYTFTIKFDESGGVTTATMTLNTTIDDWEDGNQDFISEYGIGDFINADGTFLKAEEVTSENNANVKAVIFSTNVTATDAADGYDAYAMNITPANGKRWGDKTVTINEGIELFPDALADMDGRAKTAAVLASETYSSIADKSENIFECLERVTTVNNKSVVSETFLPSFGQWIEFLNNLGNAGITADTELGTDSDWQTLWTSQDKQVITTINTSISEKLGEGTTLLGNNVYLSVTESDNVEKFWSVQISDANWSFGKNPAKDGTRTALTCIAVKLPKTQLTQQ